MTPPTLSTFADRHRLRITSDGNRSQLIPGRVGHIYDWEDGVRLALMITVDSVTRRLWEARRRRCEAAGMERIQYGDTDGTLLFDAANPAQGRVALRAIGAVRRRQRHLSAAQRQALGQRLANARKAHQAARIYGNSGVSGPKTDDLPLSAPQPV